MHQQNGCAEWFIQTIVEKAQAICLESCIPQNWWEFAVNYTVHVYNHTPLKCSSNDYKTPFERLQHTKPDVAHLRVFGCGAYIFLPEDTHTNNLSPRSELMTFIGLSEGTKGYIFMRSPNNIIFTAIQALFDETLFPKCPNMCWLGYTPVGLIPDNHQGEHNIPLVISSTIPHLISFSSYLVLLMAWWHHCLPLSTSSCIQPRVRI